MLFDTVVEIDARLQVSTLCHMQIRSLGRQSRIGGAKRHSVLCLGRHSVLCLSRHGPGTNKSQEDRSKVVNEFVKGMCGRDSKIWIKIISDVF